MTTWPEVLAALVARTDLTAEQTTWAMGEILAGEATAAQIAGFAIGLKAKGETVEEVSGLAEAMYAARTPIEVPGRLLDVVGTGGDRSMSVNISTMAAIVAAGAGAKVVKHGNRSASSQSGSADVLEALGIRLDLDAGPGRAGRRGGRHHLLLRRGVQPGDAAHGGTPTRARRRHHLQHPRSARQPDPARRPGRRLRRSADGPGDGRGVRRPRRRRVGVPRRRRSRRAHHHDHLVAVGRPRRRGHHGHGRPRAPRHRAVESRGAARGRRRPQRRGGPSPAGGRARSRA